MNKYSEENENNINIVLKFFAAVVLGDMDVLKNIIHKNCKATWMYSVEGDVFPEYDVIPSVDLTMSVPERTFTVTTICTEGSTVVAEVIEEFTDPSNDGQSLCPIVYIFNIEDNSISSMRHFSDPQVSRLCTHPDGLIMVKDALQDVYGQNIAIIIDREASVEMLKNIN